MKFKSNFLLMSTIVIALTLTSCGANNQSLIATSVAETVQAQNAQSASSSTNTPPPLATNVSTTDTPAATSAVPSPTILPSPVSSPSTGTALNCSIVANFISEDTPDGTIEAPGAVFVKTWNVQNNGTCTWDTSWKIAYDKGDLLGGAYVYNFPQTVAPGQTVPIAIQFTAPTNEGTYTGYWLLEAPNGAVFGVGQYNAPLSVSINVNSGTPGATTPTVYSITSVTYSVSQTGTCNSANLFFTISATLASSGPLTVTYRFDHSDGGTGTKGTLTFTNAGFQTVNDIWSVKVGSASTAYWDQLVITSPIHKSFGKQAFYNYCH